MVEGASGVARLFLTKSPAGGGVTSGGFANVGFDIVVCRVGVRAFLVSLHVTFLPIVHFNLYMFTSSYPARVSTWTCVSRWCGWVHACDPACMCESTFCHVVFACSWLRSCLNIFIRLHCDVQVVSL